MCPLGRLVRYEVSLGGVVRRKQAFAAMRRFVFVLYALDIAAALLLDGRLQGSYLGLDFLYRWVGRSK